MSKQIQFISPHASMLIMRKPIETTRSVNGVMQIVKEDQPPFQFGNGYLSVSEEEAEEIKKGRGYGTLYELVPGQVKSFAEKSAKKSGKSDTSTPETETAPAAEKQPDPVEMTAVDSVTNFNEASTYLKEEWGLEHKDVNSKDKVFEQAARLNIEFPNFPQEDEE